jgi:hypothetical protein
MINLINCEVCKIQFSIRSISAHVVRKHHIPIKQYYDSYVKNNIEDICLICGHKTDFRSFKNGYYQYCSQKCATNSVTVKEKKKQTCKERTGYEFSGQFPTTKEKIKQVCINRFGYISSNQAPIVKEKKKQTCLEKYGVDNYAKTSQFRQVAREQMQCSIMKNYPIGSKWCPRKGNFEKEVFDELQKYCNHKLLENQEFIGFSPDRYIKESNIIIELYEDWHNRLCFTKHDRIRQKDLEDHLHCKFFIIWLKDWLENKERIIENFKKAILE